MTKPLTATILKDIAWAANISGLEISRSRDGSVGAHSWENSETYKARLARLENAAVVAGYVITARTEVGFSACAPQDVDKIRENRYRAQAPIWKG